MSSDENQVEQPVEEKEEKEIIEDLRNPDVVTKYRKAGDIATLAMAKVIELCKPGAKVIDICIAGDELIVAETAKVYKNKKDLLKGVGFPTCVSVNNVVGHVSPLPKSTAANAVLAEGDLVKLDLGCHIDGYLAVQAHSFVLGPEGPLAAADGKKADVLAAAWTAAECALRLMRPGNTNTQVTDIIGKAASEFKCNPVANIVSHQLERHIIDGEKIILNKEEERSQVKEVEFEVNEVYALDIVMSTGEGKVYESEEKTTVFKRSLDVHYQLRQAAARKVLSEIEEKFPTFPFTTRVLPDAKSRFGVVECARHDLLQPYPVLIEQKGDFIAHIKMTVLIMPNGPLRVTQSPFDRAALQPSCEVQSTEIVELLKTAVNKKKKNKKKKKKAAAAAQ